MLPQGEHVLVLKDLPMTVESDSVRASGANPHVTIVHVDVTIQDNTESERRERDALTQEFKTLLEQQAQITDEISVQDERIAFLTDVRQSASLDMGKAVAAGDTTLQNLTDFIQYIAVQLRDAQALRRDLLTDKLDVESKLNAMHPKVSPEVRATYALPSPPNPNPPRRTFGRIQSPNPPQSSSSTPSRFGTPKPSQNSSKSDQSSSGSPSPRFGRLGRSASPQNKVPPSPPNPFGSRSAAHSPFTLERQSSYQSIVVTVMVEEATEWVLELSYTVQNVQWETSYDVRIEGDRVSMSLVAMVYQNTGEDWPAVPLTISNARLSKSGNMPRIRPWLIDAERPPTPPRNGIRRRFSTGPDNSAADNSQGGSFFNRIMANTDFAQQSPALSPSGLTDRYDSLPKVNFEVAEVQAIPSSADKDDMTKVSVSTLLFAAKVDFVAVPGQAHDIYKRARVKNTTDYTLLPGTLMIFNNSEFVGKGEMKAIAPGETFSFQAGVEDRITLDRKMLEQIATGPLGSTLRRTEFTYRISLVNESDEDAIIALYERLPIARNKQIKVFIKTFMPEPNDQTDSNIYMWKVFLGAGERQDIHLAFVLEHPRDMKLISLK